MCIFESQGMRVFALITDANAQVNGRASAVECAVQGLLLDELELASLRGEVQEAALSLNLEQRLGRAVVSIAGPRFSGLQGQSLSGAFRWERDVVRLERAVLQQANSRCASCGRSCLRLRSICCGDSASPVGGALLAGVRLECAVLLQATQGVLMQSSLQAHESQLA